VFFVLECYPYPIIKHLLDEGYEVLIGVLKSETQLLIPGLKEEATPQEKEQRLSVYDHLVHKNSADTVLKLLWKVPEKERNDYFIFFDFNDMYTISEKVLKMGFKNGLFPTKFYYDMEKNRDDAKKFVKDNYPSIVVAESFNFTTIKEGIDFINESEDSQWVLKSNGNHAGTIVPKTDDVNLAKQQIIEALKKHKTDYEEGGFLLEERVPDCLEVTPVMVFYNGKPIYSIAEFESKEFGAGNIGVQKGGNLCLSVKTPLDCELNRIAFPKAVYDLAKKQPGLSIFDAGLLYDGEDFYFTEFCAMRYGWDGIFSEIVMRDDGEPFVGQYFEDIAAGEDPLVNTYGATVRLFNLNGRMEETDMSQDGIEVGWDAAIDNNLFLYRVKKNGAGVVTVGGFDLLGVATGASDVLETAVAKAYAVVAGVQFDKLYYRPKFDFLSMDYKSSILNRFAAVKPYLENRE
jgi:phosphoribosylamine-glycine ligase